MRRIFFFFLDRRSLSLSSLPPLSLLLSCRGRVALHHHQPTRLRVAAAAATVARLHAPARERARARSLPGADRAAAGAIGDRRAPEGRRSPVGAAAAAADRAATPPVRSRRSALNRVRPSRQGGSARSPQMRHGACLSLFVCLFAGTLMCPSASSSASVGVCFWLGLGVTIVCFCNSSLGESEVRLDLAFCTILEGSIY